MSNPTDTADAADLLDHPAAEAERRASEVAKTTPVKMRPVTRRAVAAVAGDVGMTLAGWNQEAASAFLLLAIAARERHGRPLTPGQVLADVLSADEPVIDTLADHVAGVLTNVTAAGLEADLNTAAARFFAAIEVAAEIEAAS